MAYSEVTGWRIDQRARRLNNHLELLPTVNSDQQSENAPLVTKSAAKRLAKSANRLAEELAENRKAMRRQEIELAARASLLTEQDSNRLADQIDQTLADAAEACGCDSAAMYMIDDDTRFLKTRAVFGLPPSRLEDEARELRGSRGDLEAMVRGVVTIDNLQETSIDTWSCPEDVAAGICAVIQQDDVPVGTLWLLRNEQAEFGKAETAAARMAATQLSLLLASASSPTPVTDTNEAIAEVAQWQCEALPVGSTLAQNWRVDGMIESPQTWATGFHAWDVLPDGSMMLVIAEATDTTARGAMSATIARAALAAHIGYRHTPQQIMQRISDTLWNTSTCEQLVSMLYVRVDPESGEGEFASAGSISAMIGNRYGYRPLVDGQTDPLNQQFATNAYAETFRMLPGETLLAYTAGMTRDGASQMRLGDTLRTAMQGEEVNPLAFLRRELAGMPVNHEHGAVSLLRTL